MLSGNKVRCVVIRVPQPASKRASRHRQDPLPWADPYILGLIDKLQREVRMEREAAGELRWHDSDFEFDIEYIDHDELPDDALRGEGLAGDAPPPGDTVAAGPMPWDDDEQPAAAAVSLAGVRHPR